MIIYGTRASHLKTQSFTGTCKHCGTENSIDLSAFQKYAHIFWIPVFPMSKFYQAVCGHCRQALVQQEVHAGYRTAYEDLKHQLRTPIWTFSGLALIAVFIGSAMISGWKQDEQDKALIQSPRQGDIYKYKTENGEYSLMKVTDVAGDTVFVVPNKYGATKMSGLSKLEGKGDSTFTDVTYSLTKGELVKMEETGEILEVIRK